MSAALRLVLELAELVEHATGVRSARRIRRRRLAGTGRSGRRRRAVDDRALNAAASYPDRIRAAASFHGGNLAGDAPDSPHRRAAEIKARVYVGTAGVDRSFPPEQSARLAEALRVAEVDNIVENYVGMGHGWAVPDHSAFDAAGAERHWKRLTGFFAETLKD